MRSQFCKIFILFFVSFSTFGYITDGLKVENPKLLHYVERSLPHSGILRKTKADFVYVEVTNDYIGLLKKLKQKDYQQAKYASNMGAHITVMLEGEACNKDIEEVGKEINFKPLGFYKIVIDDKEYFMLAIDSTELYELRKKYGLSSKIENHPFHITLGVKKFIAEDEMANVG